MAHDSRPTTVRKYQPLGDPNAADLLRLGLLPAREFREHYTRARTETQPSQQCLLLGVKRT